MQKLFCRIVKEGTMTVQELHQLVRSTIARQGHATTIDEPEAMDACNIPLRRPLFLPVDRQ